jgi:hypothetical protein
VFQHARYLGYRRFVLWDVLEDLGCDDVVERGVGERKAQGVGSDRHERSAFGDLTLRVHRRHPFGHVRKDLWFQVRRDHVRAALKGFEGVPAVSTSKVKQDVAGADAEPIELEGQHRAASYSSTVR